MHLGFSLGSYFSALGAGALFAAIGVCLHFSIINFESTKVNDKISLSYRFNTSTPNGRGVGLC